jgi:hypothetical protein
MNVLTELAGAFEACGDYRAPIEHDEPVCSACGHLADDHRVTAPVFALADRRSPRVARPARRAS